MAEAFPLPMNKIRVDESVQARGETSEAVIKEYAEAMDRGDQFPPIVVYIDEATGEGIIADGFHRYYAQMRTKPNDPILCEQRLGTIDDARWTAITANKDHGFPRTNEQKRHAVRMAILHPKARHMSRREIARHVGVSNRFAGDIWADMTRNDEIPWVESPTEKALRAVNDPANVDKSNREIAREIHVAEQTVRRARSAPNVYGTHLAHPDNEKPATETAEPAQTEPERKCIDCDYWIKNICQMKGDIRQPEQDICEDFRPRIKRPRMKIPPPDYDNIELLEDKPTRRKRGAYRKLKGCVQVYLPKANPQLFAVELRNNFSEQYLTACWTALKHILADDE
mgnify:CR=1 FL=1